MPPIGISRAENCRLMIYYVFEISTLGCVYGYDHSYIGVSVSYMALNPNFHSPSRLINLNLRKRKSTSCWGKYFDNP